MDRDDEKLTEEQSKLLQEIIEKNLLDPLCESIRKQIEAIDQV